MKIKKLTLENFKGFDNLTLDFNEETTVLFGINGVGKSSILEAIKLIYSKCLRHYQLGASNETNEVTNIKAGELHCSASLLARIDDKEQKFEVKIENAIGVVILDASIGELMKTDTIFEKMENIPILACYGANRAIIFDESSYPQGTEHTYKKEYALINALAPNIAFEDFFKWYREQRELENDIIVNDDPNYTNLHLEMVKNSILGFLPGFTDLRIRFLPARLSAIKDKVDLSINQLSDGELNILAITADIARRLVIANPKLKEPLLGEGLVLIDEVDAHLHPRWQEQILSVLQKTFPHVQFIVTTHAPIVMRDYRGQLIELSINDGKITADLRPPLYRWDVNHIIETELDTPVYNLETEGLLLEIFELIDTQKYDEAKRKIKKFKEDAAGYPHPEMVRADLLLAKGKKCASDRIPRGQSRNARRK